MYTSTHLHGISVYHSMYTSMNISIPLRVLVLICMRPVFSGHNETFQFTSGHHYQTGHPAMNGFRTIHYNIEYEQNKQSTRHENIGEQYNIQHPCIIKNPVEQR